LRRLAPIVRAGGRAGGRSTSYLPCGEGLESKWLLSAVLGWSGGNAGNTNSLITPANISHLKETYSHALDGQILADPISASVDVTVGQHQGTQNLVFVATENDSLYAFNTATGQLVWHLSTLKAGETPLPKTTYGYSNGITSTPVIDPSSNTIYFVTTESYVSGNTTHDTLTLHAVNMSDGTERPGSPVVIANTGYEGGQAVSLGGPSVPGTGAGSVGGRDYFYVDRTLQRPGLTIDGKYVVIGFGSYGDLPPYHGWVLAYNKASLQLTGVFNDTPNGSDGGIWNSGGPVQTDSSGYLYTETGNGTFDTSLNRQGFPSKGDYGDSVLKLAIDPGYVGPNGRGIRVVDYFTPSNQAYLNKYDGDLASAGVLILPNGMGGPAHPDLLLASGKAGTIYVLNRANMGHFHAARDQIVQEIPKAITKSFDTPAFYHNTVYYAGAGDAVRSFNFVNGRLVQTGHASNSLPFHGANPVASSDGNRNGIIWVISSNEELIAYNAKDLGSALWSAPLPSYSTFSIPDITQNGHVDVGAGSVLVGFGL
jgi:hypothetical protein